MISSDGSTSHADRSPLARWLGRIGRSSLGLYAAGMPLAIAASHLADGWLPPVTALDQVRHLLLPLSLPLLVAAALTGRRRTAGLLILLIAWTTWSYGPRLRDVGPTRVPQRAIAVGTWNVDGVDPERAIGVLIDADVDVWLLQDASPSLLRRFGHSRELIAHYPNRAVEEDDGKATLSRYRFNGPPSRLVLDSTRAHQMACIDVDGASLRLINLRAATWTALLGRLAPGSADVDRIATLVESDEVPTVVGGDLATSDQSAAVRRLTAGRLADPGQAPGAGLSMTYRPSIVAGRLPPILRRDYLLVGSPLEAIAHHVLSVDLPAAHHPVVVDVVVP